ncbi:MAG: PIN domain-containing protein [Verrucomicrobiales bacterium]|nr:PIN domain-containing protein [Verrucomicrobiales bacterium]
MRTVLLDSSVLVAGMVDQLRQHGRALDGWIRERDGGAVLCCTSHAVAECYATLTALPLARPVQPVEARELMRVNVLQGLKVLSLNQRDYEKALDRVVGMGLRSGVVYDALHLVRAERERCDVLLTFNLRDFTRLEPEGVEVIAP